MKRLWPNLLLLSLTVGMLLVLSELLLRLLLNPGDFLVPTLIEDPLLGVKITPNAAGHDAWGFRNPAVPESVDLVTIGDSQTYGFGVPAADSWPAALHRLTAKTIYNLALGSYGPAQYDLLLQNYALKLHPKTILVGFYFGNDLLDAYTSVYEQDGWASLRQPGFTAPPNSGSRLETTTSRARFFHLRNWLRHHSLLYRLLTNFTTDYLAGLKMRLLYQQTDNIVMFHHTPSGIRTGLTPQYRLAVVDLDDPRIAEGLRLSLLFLQKMHDLCQREQIQFRVVLIPTKESVFALLAQDQEAMRANPSYQRLLENERSARIAVIQFCQNHQIPYTDVLPPLQQALAQTNPYPSDQDGHPNKDGYEIIARAVQRDLSTTQP